MFVPRVRDSRGDRPRPGERSLIEAGLPITTLKAPPRQASASSGCPEDRGLEPLILLLCRLDDVLVAERMVDGLRQPPRERHRRFGGRVRDLDSQAEGTLPTRRCRCLCCGISGRSRAAAASPFPQSRRELFEHLQGARRCRTSSRMTRPNHSPIGSSQRGSPRCPSSQRYSKTPHSFEQVEPTGGRAYFSP